MEREVIFSVCPDNEFFGREREMEYISGRIRNSFKPSFGMYLLGRRWIGKTEVLRRIYHRLFWESSEPVPVYYRFRDYYGTEGFAEDYIKEVVKQYIAFTRRDPYIARDDISLDKLERLVVKCGLNRIGGLIERHREIKKSGDTITAIKNAVSVPRILTQGGPPVLLILDDFDLTERIALYRGGPSIARELMEGLSGKGMLFLAGSTRRTILEDVAFCFPMEVMELKGLDEDTSISMMVEMCREYEVDFDTEIHRFASKKLSGNPMYIKNIVWASRRTGRNLLTLKDFVDLYVAELIEGNIGYLFRSTFAFRGMLEPMVLNTCMDLPGGVSVDELVERLPCGQEELKEVLAGLADSGLVEDDCGIIRWTGDEVQKDFVSYIHETGVNGKTPEEATTFIVCRNLKDGFNFQGIRIHGKVREEVSELIKGFNGQGVFKILFNNGEFSRRYRDGRFLAGEDEEKITLPQIAGYFNTSRLEIGENGPPIIIAHGFQNDRYDAGNEVIWIVGIKETLSKVHVGDVENFIRRSHILRQNFRPLRTVKWIIGREGFTQEALERMELEGIYSSDATQLDIIKGILRDGREETLFVPVKEFEVVLPSSRKAELVAVRAVEEIGEEMGFDEDSVDQIKTAVVEACINAFEHSRIKSGKVRVRFVDGRDRLVIYIQNSGVDFRPSFVLNSSGRMNGKVLHKRGWGIELMKNLMDEVRFEELKGGTRIVMVKYLKKG